MHILAAASDPLWPRPPALRNMLFNPLLLETGLPLTLGFSRFSHHILRHVAAIPGLWERLKIPGAGDQ